MTHRCRPPSSASPLLALLLLLVLVLLRWSPLLLFQLFASSPSPLNDASAKFSLSLELKEEAVPLLLPSPESGPTKSNRNSLAASSIPASCFRRAPTPFPRLPHPVRRPTGGTRASGEGSDRAWLRKIIADEDKKPLLVVRPFERRPEPINL